MIQISSPKSSELDNDNVSMITQLENMNNLAKSLNSRVVREKLLHCS